jgi:hypothetical protein
MDVLRPVMETRRLPAPGEEPMGVAFHEGTLWVACREAHRLYALEPASGAIVEEIQTPGAPFGIAFFHSLCVPTPHIVCGDLRPRPDMVHS